MKGNTYGNRTTYKQSELMKIKTQIRAELNKLRRAYKNSEHLCTKNPQRKHFLDKLCSQTLQEPNLHLIDTESLSPVNRGKRRVSPVNTPNPNSGIFQKRHYPVKYKDNVSLSFSLLRRSSSYLLPRQNSATPHKDNKSILSFVDSKDTGPHRPSKRIIPNFHTFAQ
jgi:hypothetical protein